MAETLDQYVRRRCRELGLPIARMCQMAAISRQTLYSLQDVPDKLPSLHTVISLANVLQVHPLRLLHLIFDASMPRATPSRASRSKHSDQSSFVRDVTYPDGDLVLPGQCFTKIWELQNVGKVAWTDRHLRCVDDEVVSYTLSGEKLEIAQTLRPVRARVSVPYTAPGDLVRIAVDFVAPHTLGTVLSYWKSEFSDGTPCFPHSVGLWVKVRVTSMTRAAQAERE